MDLIEEVANSASVSAPGWAYVPDTGFDPSKAPFQPSARKRNTRIQHGGGDTTARQSNAILKRLAALDRDNFKDAHIPIPSRQKEGGGRSKGKTPATRKILLAQKTFTNYLADEEALMQQEPQSIAPKPKNISRRRSSSRVKAETSMTASESIQAPADQVPGAFLGTGFGSADDFRLLQSVVPSAPSEALLEALVTAPPLSFNAARGQPLTPARPQRHFCELCGYWGTIKCLQCGARVCGLACKQTHDEDRCQRYSV